MTSPTTVRPQEFLKNVKREFSKLVAVLQAYALIATRVRLIATNQVTGQGPEGHDVQVSRVSHQSWRRVCFLQQRGSCQIVHLV